MKKFYFTVGENGRPVCGSLKQDIGGDVKVADMPDGFDPLDMNNYRYKKGALVREPPQELPPVATEPEKLRADMDYLLMIHGALKKISVKEHYDLGLWPEQWVKDAVGIVITKDEADEMIGVVPEPMDEEPVADE